MFTGIVQEVGRVAEIATGRGSVRLAIASSLGTDDPLAPGESIAVDGVCLTVADRAVGRFDADVVAETLARTTLGDLKAGASVNLERSLRPSDRLGGHMVQGHVDATARIRRIDRRGDDRRVRIETSPEIAPYVAYKGSVTLQGVSLTISHAADREFEVALVPHTLAHTTLGALRVGDRVNVETDVVARYLERLIRFRRETTNAATARRARDA